MLKIAAPALIALGALTTGAVAQPEDDRRYQIEIVGDQMLRLDRVSGRVEACATGRPLNCETLIVGTEEAPSEGAPSADVAALEDENAELRARVAELERRLSEISVIVAEAGELETGRWSVEEARRDIDEAVEVTDYAVRRFRDLFRAFSDQ